MADGKVTIDKPVKIVSDSKEQVALELMKIIADKETPTQDNPKDNRQYWLKLYFQCRNTVMGSDPKPTE